METIVIVGSGPAGYTAAVYAARAGLNPLLIEGDQPGGQLTMTSEIENFPGFPETLDGTSLMLKMRAQAERFGTRLLEGKVAACDFKGSPLQLTLGDSSIIEAKTVIIATGAGAIYLGLESEQKLIGHGVSGCATCDGPLYRAVPVAVVGGGDTAAADALFLARFASKIFIIHRRDKLRASKILTDRATGHPKIEILWDSVVEEVLGEQQKGVTGLRLKNVKTGGITELPVSGLFVAIGHSPNSKPFAGQVAMNEKGYIITENTKTSVPGVFAAGDVQDQIYRQAVSAAGSGCIAALEAERFLNEA